MFPLPNGVKYIIKKLSEHGHEAYVVGGAVRDLLMKKPVYDWDIATDALPKQIMSYFPKVVPTGLKYGTVTVILKDGNFEVTTYRKDEKYSDGRHPDKVTFTSSIYEDLARRDFTINAIAYDFLSDKIIDPFKGEKDISKKIIRTVGDPIKRFLEDGLRPLRACRFAAKLEFKIENKTLEAIKKSISVFKKVAIERVKDELLKMLSSEHPSIGFEYMRKSGLLKIVLPELFRCINVKQPKKFHAYDVYYHSIYSCDAAPKELPLVRLAALLHDISKPDCKKGNTFYDHDNKGAETAEKIMKRLKFSNNDIKIVTNLIKNHMFNYSSDWTDAAVRRFIKRVGQENVEDLFLLRIADMKAMHRRMDIRYLQQLRNRIKRILEEENALSLRDLKVNGNDIMKTLKIKQSPLVGEILNYLLENVLENPKLNDRKSLLNLAKQYFTNVKNN